VTVSEQRGSEPASKKSEPVEKKAGASTKSNAAGAKEASNEDISRLLLQVQELLMERLPKGEDVEEEDDLTAEDVAAYAKVRAFLLGRRRGGLGSLRENLEDAVAVIAEARDEIDDYLEAIDLEQDRGRSSHRLSARR